MNPSLAVEKKMPHLFCVCNRKWDFGLQTIYNDGLWSVSNSLCCIACCMYGC